MHAIKKNVQAFIGPLFGEGRPKLIKFFSIRMLVQTSRFLLRWSLLKALRLVLGWSVANFLACV